jgi:hypothetical protein
MSRNGIVETLVTDNGPQFSSGEFKDFAKCWDFHHKTSSPLYPKGNALAEKGVGIAKKLMTKAKASGQNPYLSFLEYRNTPLECGYTPAQLLLGRRTKSILPITKHSLKPKTVNDNTIRCKMSQLKAKQKTNYDRQAKPLKPLLINDPVRIQFGKTWELGKVVDTDGQRSYTLQTKDGKLFRRNRSALIKTNENLRDISPFRPNIFANNEQNESSTQESECKQSMIHKAITPTKPYVTRYGRTVKAKCFDNNEWVTT